MSFGTFVCSRCSGLHRELNHKVKGLGMCVFKDDEVAFLTKWGNENARNVWMKKLKKSMEPPPKDNVKLKDFMRAVFEQKKYYENEEEEKEKKAKKKAKKHKEEEEEENSEEDEEEEKEKKSKKKKEKPKEKEKEKPKEKIEPPKETSPKDKKHSITPAEKKPSPPIFDILDFGDSSAPASKDPVDVNSWADFTVPDNTVQEKTQLPPIKAKPAPTPKPTESILPPGAPDKKPGFIPSPLPLNIGMQTMVFY